MKIYSVKKGNREYTCRTCGSIIKKGEPRTYITPRYGPVRDFCKYHHPRPSDMTSSDKLVEIYQARESLEDLGLSASTLEDLQDILGDARECLESARDSAQDVQDQYQESHDNMGEYFPNGAPVMDEIQEKIEACEEWVGTLEEALSDLDELEGEIESFEEEEGGEKVEDFVERTVGEIQSAVDKGAEGLNL